MDTIFICMCILAGAFIIAVTEKESREKAVRDLINGLTDEVVEEGLDGITFTPDVKRSSGGLVIDLHKK